MVKSAPKRQADTPKVLIGTSDAGAALPDGHVGGLWDLGIARAAVGDPAYRKDWPMPEAADDDEQPCFAEVVYTEEELAALFANKHHNWRWAGLVSLLVQRRAALHPRLRDHELGYAQPTGERARDGMAVSQFVIDALQDVGQISEQLSDFMTSPAFVAVFGDPEDEATADADGIRHAGSRLMDFYERLLALAERARGLAAPSEYRDVLNNTARVVDTSLDGFHKFIDEFVARVAEMPALLLAANGENIVGEPMVLHIETDSELLDTIVEQLRQIADEAA